MSNLDHLIKQNSEWAEDIKRQDPDFFNRLSKQQKPKILWIGCSDSRVPANQIIGLPPGEVFVHRNIANVVAHSDLNCLSVVHYAVEVLAVEHIVVCGHYGCGGVAAAMDEEQYGLIDNWLHHIKDISRIYAETLANTPKEKRADVLCELNVREQLKNVADSNVVKKAWQQGKELTLHGWIYSIKDGLIRKLDTIEK